MLFGAANGCSWRPREKFRDKREPSVTTRREVLKYAGLGLGAAAASVFGVNGKAVVEASEAQAPAKPAQTEVTDKSGKRLAAGAEIAWTKAAKKAGQGT